MCRTIFAYKTFRFAHIKVGKIFFEFTTREKQREIADKLCRQTIGNFVVILDDSDQPITSFNCEVK